MLHPPAPASLQAPELSESSHRSRSTQRSCQQRECVLLMLTQTHTLEQTLKQQIALTNLSLQFISVKTTTELSAQLTQFKDALTGAARPLELLLICDKTALPCQELLAAVATLPTAELIWISDSAKLADVPAAWLAPAASSSPALDGAGAASTSAPQFTLQHVVGSQEDEHALAGELRCVMSILDDLGRSTLLPGEDSWGQRIAAQWCSPRQPQQGEAYHSWLTSTPASRQLASSIQQTAAATTILSQHWAPKIYSVCRELMSNAVYDAPWAAGLSDYQTISKRKPLHLKPEHWSRVWWGWNEDIFWLEVTDPFGLLKLDNFVQHIAKATQVASKNQVIDHKAQHGAGLGFFQIFTSSSAIITLSQPGAATTLVAIFQPRRHKPTFHNDPRSFHFFTGM